MKMNSNIEDQLINLNGQISDRKRAQQKLKEAKGSRKEDLTDSENETYEECMARLAERAALEEQGDVETLTKSLGRSVSNFLRRRTRRPEVLAKSLRGGQHLVLPVGKAQNGVTSEFLLKACSAFDKGIITGTQMNTIDLCRRGGFALEDAALVAKIRSMDEPQ